MTTQEDIEKIRTLRLAFYKYAHHTEECRDRNRNNLGFEGFACICGFDEIYKEIWDAKAKEPYNFRTGHHGECSCDKCK